MKKIVAVLNVLEDALKEASECETFDKAISQEMGWLHDSGILCESWQEVQGDSDTDLEQYQKHFGNIVFPDPPGEGQSEIRRDIYRNPVGWMYSMDGIRWKKAPVDIGKIDYVNAMFRETPKGVIVGVEKAVRENPENFDFSTDNGHTWRKLYKADFPTGHHWIFHGDHSWVWFKERNVL